MLVEALGALSVTAWNCLRKPECTLAPGYRASNAGDSGALFSLQASSCMKPWNRQALPWCP